MDLHPSGVPRLVGPEGGSPFSSDMSSSFRYLPNNVTNELPPSNLESLPLARSHSQPLNLKASAPRASPHPHPHSPTPPRLRTSSSESSSPRALLPPSSASYLLQNSDVFAALTDSSPKIGSADASVPLPARDDSDIVYDVEIANGEIQSSPENIEFGREEQVSSQQFRDDNP